MGTRSLTHIYDDTGDKILCTIYRQYDGYPTGHGQELKDILVGSKLVNGYRLGQDKPLYHNTMGCLAATVIAKLKGDSIGDIYIYEPGSQDCGEEYVYTIYTMGDDPRPYLRVFVVDEEQVTYEGPIDDFDAKRCEACEGAE